MKTQIISLLLLVSLFICSFTSMAQNVAETPIRDFQVSVIPFVGTDGRDAAHYQYKFSLNIFAGVTGGVEGFEAGGFMNVNTGSSKGAQFAGFGNLVHGGFEGFQGSGFMNLVHGNTKAFQGAGFMNFVSGSSEGFVGAGFLNVIGGSSKSFTGAGFGNIIGGSFEGALGAGFGNVIGGNVQGVQGSGFVNIIGGHFQGAQGAGFANIIGGHVKGIQAAGFANITGGQFQGLQAAGFANVTGNLSKGLQTAGFMNINRDLKGAQVAGFLNVAHRVEGVQIGFLNIADTVDGVPIGFLSIVKKGAYRQIEIAGSDVMHMGASFRIGVPVLYNIFSFGIRPFSDEKNHGFGFGIGSQIRISETAAMQVEAHSTQLHKHWKWHTDHLDMLNELRLTVGTNLGSRLEVFAGPVLYNHIYKHDPERGITGSDLANYTIHDHSWNDYVSKWWIGARGGLRLNVN